MNGPGEIFAHSARRFGDRPALVTDTRTLSHREADRLIDRAARALVARGHGGGTVISLFADNSWQWVIAAHAAHRAGAVLNPLNPMLTADELRFVVDDSGASVLVTDAARRAVSSEVAAGLDAVGTVICLDDPAGDTAGDTVAFGDLLDTDASTRLPEIDPVDRCLISYTSGTTGRPKGAVQNHRAVLLNAALTATMHGRQEHDVVLTPLPASHSYGNVVINGSVLAGGTVVMMARFAPDRAIALLQDHRVTLFDGVPAMYSMLLAHPDLDSADLSALTRCTVGGQTISRSVIDRWERRTGAPLIELWGMTETSGPGITHAVHASPLPGSIGVAMPGMQVRIADLDDPGAEAAPGTPGELMVRGPLVMMGYHNKPEATAETIEPDGWLHTGDIATVDDTGHVFVVDRKKDLILSGGYNVYPAEIERVLAEHPGIALVGAAGIPDEVRGEIACAYVVPVEGVDLDTDELVEFARARLAGYKRPRRYVIVDDLPRTSSGKIVRRDLAALLPREEPEAVRQ